MQFHRNGFRPGDPAIQPPSDQLAHRQTDRADVVIVGCGPAGLTLAAQLSRFADIHTVILDQKSGPLEMGQADGIACRSIEMFQAFGFSERVLKEAYWVNETTFWAPSEDNGQIARSGRIQDVADDLSEMPHVILSQARVHDFYLDLMRQSPNRLEPTYDCAFVDFDLTDDSTHPIAVTVQDKGALRTIHAKYLVGCDGARSGVRQSIGAELIGEAANKAWGVMDVLVDTDFPDIRMKSVVRSQDQGNLLIIPREGGFLVRLYVEMETLAKGERVRDRNITCDDLIAAAGRILAPYSFNVKDVAWWSVYEIGQRLCSSFDNSSDTRPPRVFITGDACHTHSPKAGQGMNVSMGDAFNLGWKLAAVLRGHAPDDLLDTYSAERQSVAQKLIDFDRHWATEFSRRGTEQSRRGSKSFQDYFEQHGQYTAGVAVRYGPSMLCNADAHQRLATGLPVGMRFHSAPVIRLWDARPMQLGHCLTADGRWRLMLFNDTQDPTDSASKLWQLCDRLSETAPAITAHVDIRAVFQQPFRAIAHQSTHPLLTPKTGRLNLADTEKMFCADPSFDIFDRRGIDRDNGCALILRPDQYVADIQPLDGVDPIVAFFDRVLRA